VLGAAGAALAGLFGTVLGFAVPLAVVGGLNGFVSGWRRIYRWRSPSGWLAFVLDSTWALATTAAALVGHTIAAAQRSPYLSALSARRDRHVYASGLRLRRGFLATIGNVINGAGAGTAATRRIVDEHEHVHVWQARWFGPLFPLLYGGWLLAGALAGTLAGLTRRRRLGATVDAWSYYRNPFEWWAYSREGRWPPPRAAAAVWRRPLVRARAAHRAPPAPR